MRNIIGILIILVAINCYGEIKSPEEFLGYKVGSDYKIARWDKIVEYFKYLDQNSKSINVIDLGTTTLGNDFIMAVISSPDNLSNINHYKEIVRKLADPRLITLEEAKKLAREGKVIVLITANIHSTEIGAAQASMELAYNLISGKTGMIDEQKVLSEVILLLIPSINPDGEIMVVDWYNKWLGTEYEGAEMPWLYHNYAGHDNNRDWYFFNLKETRLVSDVYYRSWLPQIVMDQHQMGWQGARMFVPPYYDPPNPNVHPLIWRQINVLGAHMAKDLEEAGKTGVISGAYFTGWWEGASVQTPWWHNIVGILTELASVNIASPIYIELGELTGSELGFPEYRQSMNFPSPWKGGLWRLRDIVEYELISSYSVLKTAAMLKEDFLFNFYKMNHDAVEKGKNEPPFAFVIPSEQKDTASLSKLIEILMLGGVEVHKAKENFIADEKFYPAGSYIVYLAQPYGRYAKDLLEIQKYPNLKKYSGGPPISPYDVTGWTLGLQMGIEVNQINNYFSVKTTKLSEVEYFKGFVQGSSKYGYLLEDYSNNSFKAINILMKEGYDIYRATKKFTAVNNKYDEGTYIIPAKKKDRDKIEALAIRHNLLFVGIDESPKVEVKKINMPKIGLYKPWLASIDEGWTRYLLEKYEFNFSNIDNKTLKNDNLIEHYNVIIFPDIEESVIMEGKPPEKWRNYYRELPPDYKGGIGEKGVKQLKKFIEDGGTILFFDSSTSFAIKNLEIPITEVLEKYKPDEFYCPGSLLRVNINNDHPIAYGMPEQAAILFNSSKAFQTFLPYGKYDRKVVAYYPDENILLSGWLMGEDKLYRKAALVDLKMGKGRVILYGFRVQHRAQTHGTFKLFFNALYYSNMVESKLPIPNE
jgi:hypothetical protein